MPSPFVTDLIDKATVRKDEILVENQERDLQRAAEQEELLEGLKSSATQQVSDAMEAKTKKGLRECYINFPKSDYSRTGIGTPTEVLERVLKEISASGEQLEGVSFELLRNAKFTAHLFW